MREKKCEICGKFNATIKVRKIIGGVIRESWVCENCVNKVGQKEQSVLNTGTSKPEKSIVEKVCPDCLTNTTEFRKKLQVGCPKCYVIFEKEIAEFAIQFHGVSSHIEGSPVKVSFPAKPSIAELKRRLDIAIKLENFEEAARLRDEIRRLENK